MHKRAIVIGGGIAGIQSALDLAEMRVETFIIESSPSIGGRMAQLDKTFPTNDCAMCILSPKLVEAGSHPYIKIITNAEVLGVTGTAPNLKLKVLKKARFVDETKCTGCGICMAKCPVKIPDPYNKGLTKTKCIRIPFPQAIPAIPIMDKENCLFHKRGKCRVCEKFCSMKAIDFTQKDEIIEIETGAIIFSAGCSEFNAVLKDEYGYKTFPNVVTSIEYERMLSASGPTSGHILRPSDQKEPEKIAFIQCVGSRDLSVGNRHCSSICCMQAAKDAVITKEHARHTECSIFYMDIRAFGKGFDRFMERAKTEYGTRFIRGRISSIENDPVTEKLIIRYNKDSGKMAEEEFDLVVLSLGLVVSEETRQTAQKLGIELNEDGFAKINEFAPLSSTAPGILVSGSFASPKDIPESVMEASGAAGAAAAIIRGFEIKEIKKTYPPEKDVRGEPPRVAAFICRCGINIAGTVDVPAVVEYASKLPGVVHSQELLFSCAQDSQKIIGEVIKSKNVNRVVVCACTPRTHEPLFQKTLAENGLNPFLFEFGNIREQCSWVHMNEPAKATEKAKDVLRMAVKKVVRLDPLARGTATVEKSALVIGGGLAGLTASLALAEQGYPVTLVEKSGRLGGNLLNVKSTLEGADVQKFLAGLIKKVEDNDSIDVHVGASIETIEGFIGHFNTALSDGAKIKHGVIIVASGGSEYKPKEYLYGTDARVNTQTELENIIFAPGAVPKRFADTVNTAVMIQCVGSRDAERPYCSRICCANALKNAIRLKELKPRMNVYVLIRDMRSYGLKEIAYQKARELGVIFLRFDENDKPEVEEKDGNLFVTVKDEMLGGDRRIKADLVALSNGIVANEDNKILNKFLKVPLDADGFFLEAHVKLRPVDFATDGIFVCGLAHYPKDISETISQAYAAAARAGTVLSKDKIDTEPKVSFVRKERCSGCGTCIEVCAYKAIDFDPKDGLALVNEALCKGCGTCAASCRAAAIDLKGFRDDQILAVLGVM
jgi:heterodisulfide reductase subunit A